MRPGTNTLGTAWMILCRPQVEWIVPLATAFRTNGDANPAQISLDAISHSDWHATG
jgi:hypothetical protein